MSLSDLLKQYLDLYQGQKYPSTTKNICVFLFILFQKTVRGQFLSTVSFEELFVVCHCTLNVADTYCKYTAIHRKGDEQQKKWHITLDKHTYICTAIQVVIFCTKTYKISFPKCHCLVVLCRRTI